MKVGDKVTVSTPWWDEPHEVTIKDVFATPVENYYVVEFPNGEMITAKESELLNKPFYRIGKLIDEKPHTNEYYHGFINACCIYDIINKKEWEQLYDKIEEKSK